MVSILLKNFLCTSRCVFPYFIPHLCYFVGKLGAIYVDERGIRRNKRQNKLSAIGARQAIFLGSFRLILPGPACEVILFTITNTVTLKCHSAWHARLTCAPYGHRRRAIAAAARTLLQWDTDACFSLAKTPKTRLKERFNTQGSVQLSAMKKKKRQCTHGEKSRVHARQVLWKNNNNRRFRSSRWRIKSPRNCPRVYIYLR